MVAIIPAEGLGRFGLNPSQHIPRNAYVSLEWLQERLGRSGRVNAIFVAGNDPNACPPSQAEAALAKALRPKLADYEIRVEETARGYFNITSDRMILDPAAEAEIWTPRVWCSLYPEILLWKSR